MKLWSMLVQYFQVERNVLDKVKKIIDSDLLSGGYHIKTEVISIGSGTALSEKLYIINGGCGAGRYI